MSWWALLIGVVVVICMVWYVIREEDK